jgi:hypothetical protein
MLALAITLQCFKPVSGRGAEVVQSVRVIDRVKFPTRDGPKHLGASPSRGLGAAAVEEIFRADIGERANHVVASPSPILPVAVKHELRTSQYTWLPCNQAMTPLQSACCFWGPLGVTGGHWGPLERLRRQVVGAGASKQGIYGRGLAA